MQGLFLLDKDFNESTRSQPPFSRVFVAQSSSVYSALFTSDEFVF